MKDREIFIKQLIYRSCNRGCKETDLLLGRFASQSLSDLSDKDLIFFAKILEQADNDIYDWLSGNVRLPIEFDHPIITKIQQFNQIKCL